MQDDLNKYKQFESQLKAYLIQEFGKFLPEDKISHCKFCDICVKDVDHHCDVVRRCITTKNFNYFISMIVNFVLLYAFALVNIIYYCIDYYRKLRKKK